MTLLTADDVLNKKFQATKFREGYEAMRQLEAENADLKAKLEAANQRVAELGETGRASAVAAQETVVVDRVDSAPIPAIQPGGPQEPAAASGMLELAQRLHNEHVANGKAEGERIIAEARSTGEQIVREAEDQRNRTLAQLEKERSGLEHKIDELRRFESDYRTRLKSYLQGLLSNVEDGEEATAAATRRFVSQVLEAAGDYLAPAVSQLAVAPLPVADHERMRSYCRGVVAAMVRVDLTRGLGQARAALQRMGEDDPGYAEAFRELMRLEQRRQNYTERD